MGCFIKGSDRRERPLPEYIDDYVAEYSPVRVVDRFALLQPRTRADAARLCNARLPEPLRHTGELHRHQRAPPQAMGTRGGDRRHAGSPRSLARRHAGPQANR